MKILLSLFLFLILHQSSDHAATAGDVFVGKQSAADSRVSLQDLDHSAWDTLLGRYVDQSGRVDYAGWKASIQDVKNLDRYLDLLSSGAPSSPTSREATLAFWINAYNAVTVRGILREYPTSSIRNHTAKLFGYNIWDDLLLHVGDRTYSLNQIEHDILRKMNEPRIHFAIVCASVGCPKLRAEAYSGKELEEQLQTNAQAFFADKKNFRFDATTDRFYLSSILDWFGKDFGTNQESRLRRISEWLPTEAARSAATRGKVSIEYIDYDWSLNGQ